MERHKQTGYRGRLTSIMSEFEKKTFEREELIRLVILAIFCKQHIFLFGRPGVGKTYIARLATMMFGPDNYWEILMAHDTTTEQLMGSLKKDENGNVYRDISDSMLNKPFPFLDEMFKGSNRVLNALLGPMLDRRYTEGGFSMDVPLVTLFGASNEFPEGEDIKPFEDRLMFRYDVQRLADKDNRMRYNNGEFDKTDTFTTKLELEEIDFVETQSKKIIFSEDMLENYIQLQDAILKDGISISDRKFGPDQAVKVFRTSAYLNGRKEVDFSDLVLLKHIAWHNLVDKKKLTEVLANTLFGNKVTVEKTMLSITDAFNRAEGIIEAHCGAILENKKEYQGQKSADEYHFDVSRIKTHLEQIRKISGRAEMLNSKKDMAFDIIKQCQKNIFLFGTSQSAYDAETIEAIAKICQATKRIILNIEQWLLDNPRLYDYNNRRLEKATR